LFWTGHDQVERLGKCAQRMRRPRKFGPKPASSAQPVQLTYGRRVVDEQRRATRAFRAIAAGSSCDPGGGGGRIGAQLACEAEDPGIEFGSKSVAEAGRQFAQSIDRLEQQVRGGRIQRPPLLLSELSRSSTPCASARCW
jgi:hypothetical protein